MCSFTCMWFPALNTEQRVISHAMISMIENHLSWVLLWWRAKYPESVIKGYQVNLQNALNTRLPNPILNFCYKLTSGRKVFFVFGLCHFYIMKYLEKYTLDFVTSFSFLA